MITQLPRHQCSAVGLFLSLQLFMFALQLACLGGVVTLAFPDTDFFESGAGGITQACGLLDVAPVGQLCSALLLPQLCTIDAQ
jgi:hypothetical protein